jgi:hypothetical protein
MSIKTEEPAVKQTAKKPAKTLGALVDDVFKLRTKKAELEAAAKDVAGKIGDLESEILDRMKAEGLEKTTGKGGTVSVGSSVVADVVDWDSFLSFIYKNKYGHLLQRRVSDPAWREIYEQKGKVPGTQPFTKTKLNFRASA